MQNQLTAMPNSFTPTALDNIALSFWQDYHQYTPIGGGMAYENKLRECVLDDGLDSLKRLDQLLTAVAHDLSHKAYDEKSALKQTPFRNFLLFVMFYVGRVVSRILNEPISWQPMEQLAQYYPHVAFHVGENKFYHVAALFPQSFLSNTNIPPLFVLLSLGAKLFGGFERQFLIPLNGEMVNDSLYWIVVDYINLVHDIKAGVNLAVHQKKSVDMQALDALFEQILDISEVGEPDLVHKTAPMSEQLPQNNEDKGRFATGAVAPMMAHIPSIAVATKPTKPSKPNSASVKPSIDEQALLQRAVKLPQASTTQKNVQPVMSSGQDSNHLSQLPPTPIPTQAQVAIPTPTQLPTQSSPNLPSAPVVPPPRPRAGATIGEPSCEPMISKLPQHLPVEPERPINKSSTSTSATPSSPAKAVNKALPSAPKPLKQPAQDNMFSEIYYDLLVLPAVNTVHQEDYKKAVAVLNKFDELVAQKVATGETEIVFNDKQVEVLSKAVNLVQKIAQAGNTDAMLSLSLCYFKGVGLPQDFEKGASWVQKAADLQDVRAQKFLSRLYYQGLGVAQVVKMGDLWLSRAAANGHPEAKKIQSQFAKVKSTQEDLKAESKKSKNYFVLIFVVVLVIFAVLWAMLTVLA